ncbi:ankyrin repeat domain-containing protein [Spiroplasma endosymbiont of Polydrusus formosus]|uniref:ankyrin repeat domain-containing protein n=1 Tax=Spiroplasma endosymbiont of Polydrusus formosus TaxID=3139326 RepID=UPI0035B531C3
MTVPNIAAKNNYIYIVKLLLEKGDKIEIAKTNGDNASLHFAAEKGHLEITELLLCNKANINVTSNNGATPLYYAAKVIV